MDRSAEVRTGGRGRRAAAGLLWTAMLLLLLGSCGRMFMLETQYRLPSVSPARMQAAGADARISVSVDRADLSRIAFDALLLLACVAALLGRAMQAESPQPVLPVWMVLALGCLPIAAGLAVAVDGVQWTNRDGQLVLLDLAALLAAAVAAMQLCRDKRKMHLLLAGLLGVGLAMAGKGLYQATFETADRIAAFEADRYQALADAGIRPGSPQETMFEYRIRDWAPVGYFGLANLFASGLLLLLGVAGGMAVDRFRQARRGRKAFGQSAAKGELHPATALAVAVAIISGLLGLVLLLTQSFGAIGSLLFGVVAAVLGLRYGGRLSKHWRKLVVVALVLFLLGGAVVVTTGLVLDYLPSKTMTFRWFYWTGGMRLVANHPVSGAGPGNFGDLYLLYRRPQAEEAVKDPHNVFVHVLGQYGLIFGGLILLILIGLLVRATRPAVRPDPPEKPASGKIRWGFGAAIVGWVVLARWLFVPDESVWLIVVNTALPGLLLALGLWLGLFRAEGLAEPGPAVRVCVVAALLAFFLHNMVTFSLTAPATATLFWVLAGASVGCWGPGARRGLACCRPSAGRGGRLALAVIVSLLLLGLLVSQAWFVLPRWNLQRQGLAAWLEGDETGAVELFEQAAQADPVDDVAYLDAAKVTLLTAGREAGQPATRRKLSQAAALIDQAVRWDPDSAGNLRQAGSIALQLAMPDTWTYRRWPLADPEAKLEQLARQVARGEDGPVLQADRAAALEQMGRTVQAIAAMQAAIRMDPQAAELHVRLGMLYCRLEQWAPARAALLTAKRLRRAEDPQQQRRFGVGLDDWQRATDLDPHQTRPRVEYARWLLHAGRGAAALQNLDAALHVHHLIPPESLMRFTRAELEQIERLRFWADVLGGPSETGVSAPPR